MAQELKSFVINMKSLYQDISDPVIVSGGDANGRILRVIFTQEAEAQFSEDTKVYLSWYHQQEKVKGYNVFTKVEEEPPTYEIHYPQSMLYEGDVLADIELVDEVSVAPSNNFIIHVLATPNENEGYTASDDYSEFQKAVIEMNCVVDQGKRQLQLQRIEFADMQLELENALETVQNNVNTVETTLVEINEVATRADSAVVEAKEAIKESQSVLEETKNIVENVNEKVETSSVEATEAKAVAEEAKTSAEEAKQIAEEALNREAPIVVYEW